MVSGKIDAKRAQKWGVTLAVVGVLTVGSVVGIIGGRITQRAPRGPGKRVVVVAADAVEQDSLARALTGAPGITVVSIEELRSRQVVLRRNHRSATDADAAQALALDAFIAPAPGGFVATSTEGIEIARDPTLDGLALKVAPPKPPSMSPSPVTPPPPITRAAVATENAAAHAAYVAGVGARDTAHFRDAAAHFREAIALDPDYAPASCALALAILMLDDATATERAEALAALQHAQGSPKLSAEEAWLVAGHLDELQAKIDDALEEYRKLTVALPEERAGHMALGFAYNRAVGAHEEALRHIEAARRITPDYFPLTREIADAWLKAGDCRHATQAVRGYLVLVPDDVDARKLLDALNAPTH